MAVERVIDRTGQVSERVLHLRVIANCVVGECGYRSKRIYRGLNLPRCEVGRRADMVVRVRHRLLATHGVVSEGRAVVCRVYARLNPVDRVENRAGVEEGLECVPSIATINRILRRVTL